jgi:DNA modification methylase
MQNRLYYGDNLEILREKVRDESVDLCYIDPPFNSKRNYNEIYNNRGVEDLALEQAFMDTWTWKGEIHGAIYHQIMSNHLSRFSNQTIELIHGLHAVLGEGSLLAYLISLTARIAEIHRVLKPTGTFFLHCDPTASHYLKVITDSIFLPEGGDFLNEIIWKRVHTVKGNFGQGSKFFGPNTDTLLFYSKSAKYTFNQVFGGYRQKYLDKFYRFTEPDGRRYRLISMIGPGGAAKGNPQYEFMGVTKYWRYSRESMQELVDNGMIVQTNPGTVPQRKLYLDKGKGVAVQSLWDDIQALSPTSQERLGYPTQKPEALLDRIIDAVTNDGDVVLDAYCGCGTTVAVAQKRNRRWIGIDITYQAIATVLRRFEDNFDPRVLEGVILDGIPKDMASARALANKRDDRVRKEFEKWAILTYTKNRGVIRKIKGADGGIDGFFYFWNGNNKDVAKMILQVKSGHVGRKDIAALRGDMEKEGAEAACLITLQPPSKPMKQDADNAGIYENRARGIECPKIRIVTVEDMLRRAIRIELPLHGEASNKARVELEGEQLTLDLKPETATVPEVERPKRVASTSPEGERKRRSHLDRQ